MTREEYSRKLTKIVGEVNEVEKKIIGLRAERERLENEAQALDTEYGESLGYKVGEIYDIESWRSYKNAGETPADETFRFILDNVTICEGSLQLKGREITKKGEPSKRGSRYIQTKLDGSPLEWGYYKYAIRKAC